MESYTDVLNQINLLNELMDTSSESEDGENEINEFIARNLDSDDDIELEVFKSKNKRNSIKNYLKDVVPTYSEEEFRQHFRINKTLFNNLCKRFEESSCFQNLRADKRLPGTTHFAVFLWFAGHEGCSFRDLSDRFDISLSSVSRIISRMTMFLSSLSKEVIKWPNEIKKEETATFFKNKCGFSKVIGCIDGTHVVIDPPPECKDDYIDRKGNVTLCMQAVCDETKKFTSIFVGFPGSSHDSWVFQNSNLGQRLPSLCGEYYLLGDSAYPCSNHLITPYKDNGHLTNAQKNFNIKLSSGRVAIEHSFGILKQRFRQLYYCKLRGARKLCHFIRACCVLHNLAKEDDLIFTEEVNEDEFQNQSCVESSRGNHLRDLICQELSNNKR